MVYGTTAHNKR